LLSELECGFHQQASVNADTHSDSDKDKYPGELGNGYVDTDEYKNIHGYEDTDRIVQYANVDADKDTNIDKYVDCDRYQYTDENGHKHTDQYEYGNGNKYGNQNQHAN